MARWIPVSLTVLAISLGLGGATVAGTAWSYNDLDHVLNRYVTLEGLVDYESLVHDRAALDRFVDAMAGVSPDSHPELFPSDAARLAYWMNAYNALMLRRVVDAWPIDSVRSIKPLYGVFWNEKHSLGGARRTLRKLENQIIRERFGEPRIHFAINCASAGCPALLNRAWRAETLEADLDWATRRFITNPDKVRIDRKAAVIHLSPIFKWFTADFTSWLEKRGLDHANGVVDYVVRYLPRRELVGVDRSALRVEWTKYDWSINAAGRPPA